MTAYPGRRKILLKHQVDAGAVMNLAGENRWFFQDCDMMSPQQTFSVYSWLVNDMKTGMDFVEDTIRDLYLIVTAGPQSEMVEKVVRAAFPCWMHDEVLRQAQEAQGADADARIEALQRLSAVAPEEAEPADLALYEAALSDPDPRLRCAGVNAVGYAEWPVLVERLRRMQGEDPDPEVRLVSLRMLQAMAKTEAERRAPGW